MYEEKFMEFDLYNDTYNFFLEFIKYPSPDLLEIGFWPGNITRYILSKRPDTSILGIDISPTMIQLAMKNNPTVSFKVMDCWDIQMLENAYNAIICGFCIPYLSGEDCSNLINNCHDLLVKDGIFYLSFVIGNYDQSGYLKGSTGGKLYFYYHTLHEK